MEDQRNQPVTAEDVQTQSDRKQVDWSSLGQKSSTDEHDYAPIRDWASI